MVAGISKRLAWAMLAASALGSAPLTAAPPAPKVPTEGEITARADALIAQMTPAEKAAQLALYFSLPNMKAANEQQIADGAGGLLLVSDPKETNRLQKIAMEKSRLHIPLIFGFDVIHGLSTVFPVPIGLSASWDPALVERSQAIAASEARAVGIHWTFAPMVDIARDPRWGRIVEGSGEDPYLGSAMAAAQVRGFQGPAVGTPGRIVAGPKHFAGYGAAIGGRDYDEANISDEELWNTYLPPFKAAVDAGAGNIMAAYMPLNGIPASGNHWLLTEVLRDRWHFKGWVVSDNSSINALRTHGLAATPLESGVRALKAGMDMELTIGRSVFNQQLPEALGKGLVTQAEVDNAVRLVLAAKIRMGLFEQPMVDEARAAKLLRSPASLAAARVAAERSAVLLRNEGALLPLDRNKINTLAVIGPLADAARDTLGPWVFKQNAPATQTILAGIREKLGARVTVTYAAGVSVGKRISPNLMAMSEGKIDRPEPADDTQGIAEAVAAAKAADVAVVVVGESFDMIGELASSSSLSLPGRQQELLDAVVATGKPVVVLVMNGRPLDLKGSKAPAILDILYPGSQGGASTANLLFGDAVPGGKLPFTWPRNAGQIPMYYSHLTTHDPRGAYSRYWNESGAPAYPFGHGLSYSTFTYANLRVDKPSIAPGGMVTISVDLKNTGTRAADEVAQLYIHQKSGSAARPIRELKGFQRVTLKPGEMRTLSFQLGPDELHYWNAATRDWVIDEASFDVAVGTDSTVAFGASFAIAKQP